VRITDHLWMQGTLRATNGSGRETSSPPSTKPRGGCYKESVRADGSQLWRSLRKEGRLFLIAGPCVIENEALCLRVAERLRDLCERLGVVFVFKASYDKANRSSSKSYRGPGLERGLEILDRVRSILGVPLLTDVHDETQAALAGEVVDVLQVPAFLCRQTDLLLACAATGRVVNVKKGQFMAPREMRGVVDKLKQAGAGALLLTERGTTFGYHNLVVDLRSIPQLKALGYPVVFDATHSVQLPGAGDGCSGGQREFVPTLAAGAVAAGANGVFLETHPNPDRAPSDGANMISLREVPKLLERWLRIQEAAR